MNLIKEFDYRNKVDYISTTKRVAVRGIIIEEDKILLAYLRKSKEYKFPGGGVEPGETLEDALYREVLEEVGHKIINIGDCLGYVDQKYTDIHDKEKCFYLRSYYYNCEIDNKFYGTNPSSSEKKLGLISKWVNIEDAINVNMVRLTKEDVHPWTERELFMLI